MARKAPTPETLRAKAALELLENGQALSVRGFLVMVLHATPRSCLALVSTREYGRIRVFMSPEQARRGAVQFVARVSKGPKGLTFTADAPAATEDPHLRPDLTESTRKAAREQSLKIRELPMQADALSQHLSEQVKGLGQTGCDRMIRAYGSPRGMVEVLEQRSADAIAAEFGIDRKRAQDLKQCWLAAPGFNRAMVALRSLGLNKTQIERALKRALGGAVPGRQSPSDDDYMQAARRICNHPFRLTVVQGIGFPTADDAAQRLGMPEDSQARILAGVRHVLTAAAEDEGHTMLWSNDLVERAALLLARMKSSAGSQPAPKIWVDRVTEALPAISEEAEGIVFPSGERFGHVPVALAQHLRDEAVAATRLAKIASTPVKRLRIPDLAQMSAWLKLTPNEQQVRAMHMGVSSKISIITGDPGTGKAQPVDTPVLVPGKTGNGWKPIGALKIGDAVVDPYGQASVVDSIHPQGFQSVYRINIDGGSTRATLDHLWLALINGSARVYTTQQLIDLKREGAKIQLPRWNGEKGLQWRTLVSIAEEAGRERCACIKLTSDSALYITNDFIVTHNTTITKGICAALKANNQRVLLMAPTGRAAKRMREATGLEARTVQSIVAEARGGSRSILDDYDVALGDEWGMTDVALYADLLRLMPDRMRNLIIGDPFQLPSVGAGSVLSDLIESGVIPVCRLHASQRIGEDHPVYAFARAIKNGIDAIPKAVEDRLELHPAEHDNDALRLIEAQVRSRLMSGLSPEELVVITAIRSGTLGVANLNQRLQSIFNPVKGPRDIQIGWDLQGVHAYCTVGDRVMQDKPDRDLGLVNGDVGIVTYVNKSRGLARIDFGEGEVDVQGAKLKNLRLNYSCTVHKSQGAEYKNVLIAMGSSHARMMRRNLLYTAVTRGKECVELVGNMGLIQTAVRNESDTQRNTLLRVFLRSEFQKLEHRNAPDELELVMDAP